MQSSSHQVIIKLKNFSSLIEEICQPLNHYFEIDNFSIDVFFPDGSFLLFNSDSNYLQHLEEDYDVNKLALTILTACKKTGFFFIDYQNDQSSVEHRLNTDSFFNFTYSLKFLDVLSVQDTNQIMLYSFNSTKLLDTHLFINNLQLFKEFTKYFSQRFEETIHAAPRLQIAPDSLHEYQNTYKNLLILNSVDKESARNLFSIWLYQKNLNKFQVTQPFLTSREKEILRLAIHQNMTYNEIANTLHLSKRTVDRHFENMRRKLQADNKVELIKSALSLNLLVN